MTAPNGPTICGNHLTAADKLTLFRRDAKTGQVKFSSPISPSTLGSYLWDSSVTGVNLNRVGPQRNLAAL